MSPKSLLILVPLVLAACGAPPAADKPGRGEIRFSVITAPVTSRDLTPETTVPARLEAAETARCTARVAGPVTRVLVTEGRAVKAGDPLVELDATRLRLTLASAEATLLKAKSAAEEAGRLLVRRQQLVQANLTSEEDLDAARTKTLTATAELQAAQAARDRAQADLADAVITAPIAGLIERRSVDTGQWLNVGSEVFTIVRRDPLQVRGQVTPETAAGLAPNLPAAARAEGQEALGAIVLVGQAADPATGRVPVLARLTQPPAAFRPGGFAELVLRGTTRSALVVPSQAVRPTERGLVAFVAVEGTARQRIVTVGERTADGGVEILTGLTAGESLIVTGADALRDGSPLRSDGEGNPTTKRAGERNAKGDGKPKSEGKPKGEGKATSDGERPTPPKPAP